jgi:SWI/SNF-related matrix-associated actin-dependent regulator of chromatin subfamily B protein 1
MQHSFVVYCMTARCVIKCGGRYWKCWFEHTFLLSDLVGFSQLDLRVNNTLIHDQFLWDVNNLKSDPEGFARGLCKDLDIKDPEVAPAIAVAIREQLYEIAKQNLATGRETRISKKARRDKGAMDFFQSSVQATTALNMMKRPNSKKISVVR